MAGLGCASPARGVAGTELWCRGQTQRQHPAAGLQEMTWVPVTHFLKQRKRHLPHSRLPLQPLFCTWASFSTSFQDLLTLKPLGSLSPFHQTPPWHDSHMAAALPCCLHGCSSTLVSPWTLEKCRCYLVFSSGLSRVLRGVPGSAATSHQ